MAVMVQQLQYCSSGFNGDLGAPAFLDAACIIGGDILGGGPLQRMGADRARILPRVYSDWLSLAVVFLLDVRARAQVRRHSDRRYFHSLQMARMRCQC